jgi:hypothetical protein
MAYWSYFSWFQIVLFMVALMSGILSIAREAFHIHYPDKIEPKSMFWRCIWIAFIVSSGWLWGIEHSNVLSLNRTLDALTKPQLEPHIDEYYIARAGDSGNDVLITATATILNHGAPSIVGKIEMHLVLPDGKELVGERVPQPPPDAKLYMGVANSQIHMVYSAADYLPTKGIANPIPTGGAVKGFYQAYFRSLNENSILTGASHLHMHFTDVNGAPYDASTSIHNYEEMPLDNRHLQDFMKKGKQ